DDVRIDFSLQAFEVRLDLGTAVREKTLGESFGAHVRALRAARQLRGRVSRLFGANGVRAQRDPVDARLRARRDEAQDSAAAADLDVVDVRAEEERRVDFRSGSAAQI